MKIVTTFHQSSSVLASVKCQLSSRDLEHLVVAKSNKIDVYSLQPHGLQHQYALEVWGNILAVTSLPIPGSSRSNILLFVGHPEPEVLILAYSEDTSSSQLKIKKKLALYERTPRPAEFFNNLLVHPSGKLAVVSCYTGKLKIITFKSGNYEQDFDVLLPELNLLALTFLPLPDDEYTLAILHLDYQHRVQLLAREILLDDLELSITPAVVLTPTSISDKNLPTPEDFSPKLVAVPPQTYEGDDEEGDNEGFLGGVLVVGGTKILMYELASGERQVKQKSKRRRIESRKQSEDVDEVEKAKLKEKEREGRKRKAQASVEWPWSEVVALCAVDPKTSRYFIGDSNGRLSVLSAENVKEQGLILIPLGMTSPPTTLTYLTNQYLYLGSHLGDSELLRISPTPVSSLTLPTLPIPHGITPTPAAKLGNRKGKGRATEEEESTWNPEQGSIVESVGSFVSVVETHKNLAPIMDAILVDTDRSGGRQIVTCSGGGNKGAINIIRNGADFKELATIPGLPGITNIWAVRNQFEDTDNSYVLVSTLESTYLFRITGDGGMTTLTFVNETGMTPTSGLITELPTLAFGNVAQRTTGAAGKSVYSNSRLVVQVTSKCALLLEYDIGTGLYQQLARYEPKDFEIVAASINPSQVLLGMTTGKLVALSITESRQFNETVNGKPGGPAEISTVSCTPLDPAGFFSVYVTVSYWSTNVVEIFILDRQGFVSVSKSPPLSALVRSAFLFNFGSDTSSKGAEYHPYLLVGLGDGSLVSFQWKDRRLGDKKVISLGHAPVSLSVCIVDDKRTILAAGNRSTVLSWEKKRLHSSPIMLKDVVAVSPFNTTAFRSSLILATPVGLHIGRVRDLDKMHIQSVPLGQDNPRRIAYLPSSKVFVVGITHIEPARVGDTSPSRSSLRLFDDTSFSVLSNFHCRTNEEVTAVTAFTPTLYGKPTPLFCVGTYTYAAEIEPTQGRLMVFQVSSGDSQTRAPAPSLQLFILAAEEVQGCVYSVAVINDMVVAAVNSSVRLYRLKDSDNISSPSYSLEMLSEWNHNYLVASVASFNNCIMVGDQLNSVSLLKVVNGTIQNVVRDHGPIWPLCVEASSEESIITANDALNLFTFTLSRALGHSVLENDGKYYLGDLVTKFIRGSLNSLESTSQTGLETQHIFVTSSGRIGVVIDVTDPQLSLHLTALQRNLAGTLTGVGGISHTRYRAPKSNRGRSDADQTSFGFIDGDFIEQFLTHLGSADEIDKIIAGQNDFERLAMPVEEIQKLLENLQNLH